jgi:hypothetical protein
LPPLLAAAEEEEEEEEEEEGGGSAAAMVTLVLTRARSRCCDNEHWRVSSSRIWYDGDGSGGNNGGGGDNGGGRGSEGGIKFCCMASMDVVARFSRKVRHGFRRWELACH